MYFYFFFFDRYYFTLLIIVYRSILISTVMFGVFANLKNKGRILLGFSCPHSLVRLSILNYVHWPFVFMFLDFPGKGNQDLSSQNMPLWHIRYLKLKRHLRNSRCKEKIPTLLFSP